MWYEIFIEDEFIKYFGDESNVFLEIEDGKKVLAPMFFAFAQIVFGVTFAWTVPELHISHLRDGDDDFNRGFVFCRENQAAPNQTYLFDIWKSISDGTVGDHYDVDPENLNAEQCAVLLMYPFWSRMGGSFEMSFQEDGSLKKYLLALKKKVEEARGMI